MADQPPLYAAIIALYTSCSSIGNACFWWLIGYDKKTLISWVQAGNWCGAIDNFSPTDAEEWLLCPIKYDEGSFALKVRGESMYNPNGERSFRDGDIIYVNPQREALHGSLAIVRLEGEKEVTFKRLLVDGNKKLLEALNPAWPNKIIQVNGDAIICGVVFGKYEAF